MDMDLLARISRAQADGLAKSLGANWVVDVDAMAEALRGRRAFNIFSLPAGLKFDIFPASDDFHAAELERATVMTLAEGAVRCRVATAEDMVLAKLQWYRSGGEVSERQWRDIVGLIFNNRSLDLPYVREWASRLRIDDLLSRALAEAARDQAR